MTKEEAIKYLQQFYPNGGHCWLDEQRIEAVGMAIQALQEKPVSKDLEEAANFYANTHTEWFDHEGNPHVAPAFKAGAKWQKEQFEKNRLAACDRQTEEEAEIERDFVTGIIDKEHRLPTFDDAIKYGMRLKEKEMQSTIELTKDHAYFAGSEAMREKILREIEEAYKKGGVIEAMKIIQELKKMKADQRAFEAYPPKYVKQKNSNI